MAADAVLLCWLAPPLVAAAALDRAAGSADEPLRLLRLAAGVLLLFGTVVAVALALTGVAPRALQLAGIFWAIYAFVVGLTSGVLEPVLDGLAHVLGDWAGPGGWRLLGDRVTRRARRLPGGGSLICASDGSAIPFEPSSSCGG